MFNTNFKIPTIIYTHVHQFETCHLVLIAINELNSKKKWQCNLILLPPQPSVFCLGTVLATKMDRLRTSLFRRIVFFLSIALKKRKFSFMFVDSSEFRFTRTTQKMKINASIQHARLRREQTAWMHEIISFKLFYSCRRAIRIKIL